MAPKEKTILVYDDFSMQNPTLMGTLYVNRLKAKNPILLNTIESGSKRPR